MNCEICGRGIIKNRHFIFKDAREHYLHKSCFNKFKKAKPYVRIEYREQNRTDSKSGAETRKKEEDGNISND